MAGKSKKSSEAINFPSSFIVSGRFSAYQKSESMIFPSASFTINTPSNCDVLTSVSVLHSAETVW